MHAFDKASPLFEFKFLDSQFWWRTVSGSEKKGQNQSDDRIVQMWIGDTFHSIRDIFYPFHRSFFGFLKWKKIRCVGKFNSKLFKESTFGWLCSWKCFKLIVKPNNTHMHRKKKQKKQQIYENSSECHDWLDTEDIFKWDEQQFCTTCQCFDFNRFLCYSNAISNSAK